jgi:hypothetical protein
MRAESCPRAHSSTRCFCSSPPRRRFAGIAGATVAAGLAPSWTPANAAIEREFEPRAHHGRLPRPNLLVILADDLGWADLSA